mmetsp:Transcript_21536/g.35540  ORF Transcript_21536/g.35540 Transcript_21536/m.35540 type:complete len:125 (-) Transcript_21536:313-687(-)
MPKYYLSSKMMENTQCTLATVYKHYKTIGISKKVGGSSKSSSLDSAISNQALILLVSRLFSSIPFLRYSLKHSRKKLMASLNLFSFRYRNPKLPKTLAVSRVDSVVLLERSTSRQGMKQSNASL